MSVKAGENVDRMSHCDFVAGVCAGACNLIIAHPFDTIKTNMQERNLRFAAATIYLAKQEGLRSYYRGFLFPLCTIGVQSSIIFGVYGNLLTRFQEWTKLHGTKSHLPSVLTNDFTQVFAAGCLGGVCKALAMTPVELTKVRLQAKVGGVTNPFQLVQQVWKQDGIKGAFRGLSAMLIRDAIPYGIFMLVYEVCLKKLTELRTDSSYTRFNTKTTKEHHSAPIDPWPTMLAGAIAGIISWIPAIPFDVIKTRMMCDTGRQRRYKTMASCIRLTVAEFGWSYLFRGGWVLMVRAGPVGAIVFMGYEHALRACRLANFD